MPIQELVLDATWYPWQDVINEVVVFFRQQSSSEREEFKESGYDGWIFSPTIDVTSLKKICPGIYWEKSVEISLTMGFKKKVGAMDALIAFKT